MSSLTKLKKVVRRAAGYGVKLYDPITQRYRHGRTRSLDERTALLEVAGALGSGPGQVIRLALQTAAQGVIVSRDRMARAAIERVVTGSEPSALLVTVRFLDPVDLPVTA